VPVGDFPNKATHARVGQLFLSQAEREARVGFLLDTQQGLSVRKINALSSTKCFVIGGH
jgi:hypothetical protein